MFLSDGTIKKLVASGELGIEPYDEALVQPCSYDVLLQDVNLERQLTFDSTWWIINAGEFVLGSILERITLPAYLGAMVAGKSTWGRKGLIVQNAGFVDAGWDGQLTLELFNHSKFSISLKRGVAIAQLVFTYLDAPAEHPYAGRYQGSEGTVQPRPSVAFQRSLVQPTKRELEQRVLAGPHVHRGLCDYPERSCICTEDWSAHDSGLLCSYTQCVRCSTLVTEADTLA